MFSSATHTRIGYCSARLRLGLLCGLGLASGGGYFILWRMGSWGTGFPRYFLLYGALFALYLAAVLLVQRLDARRAFWIWLGFALIFYVLLVPAVPSLSDDIYRYLWEGKIQAAGYNPYCTPPAAAGLTAYRDSLYAHLSSTTTTALYPPVAQILFLAVAGINPSIVFFKCILGLFFLGTCVLLAGLLAHHGRNPHTVLVWAWNPLVIIETAGSGHFDIVAVFFVLAAVWLLQQRRENWALAMLGAAGMVKYYALVYLPLWLGRLPGRWRRPLAVWLAVVCAVWLPYCGAGTQLFDSLGMFYRHWCFNSLPYYWFMAACNSRGWYLALYAGLIGAVMIGALRRPGRPIEPGLLAVTTVLVLFSPVVYPWYLVWLLPFCLFARSFPLVLFALVVNSSYAVLPRYLTEKAWHEDQRIIFLQYAVLGICCLVYYRRSLVDWAGVLRRKFAEMQVKGKSGRLN